MPMIDGKPVYFPDVDQLFSNIHDLKITVDRSVYEYVQYEFHSQAFC